MRLSVYFSRYILSIFSVHTWFAHSSVRFIRSFFVPRINAQTIIHTHCLSHTHTPGRRMKHRTANIYACVVCLFGSVLFFSRSFRFFFVFHFVRFVQIDNRLMVEIKHRMPSRNILLRSEKQMEHSTCSGGVGIWMGIDDEKGRSKEKLNERMSRN